MPGGEGNLSQAVVFDWGGVLMRTEDRGPRRAWDRRLALPLGAVERIVFGLDAWRLAQLGEIDPEVHWHAVGKALGLESDSLATFRRDFYSGDRLDIDLITLIRDLRGWDVLVGLLSNNSLELHSLLRNLELDGLFDACVISAELGVMKPHPDAYYAILRKLQVLPENVFFVDDFVPNISGARAVGMSGLHFTPGIDMQAALADWLSRT